MRVVKLSSVGLLLIGICTSLAFAAHMGGFKPETGLTAEVHGSIRRKVVKTPGNSPASSTKASSVAVVVPHLIVSKQTGPPAWTKLPLYTDPTNEATTYVQSNPTAPNASLIAREGQVPVTEWFGDWSPDVQSDANTYVSAATQANAVPVLALYNIPERDCGGYSSGGATSGAAYVSWIQQVSAGIGNRLAVVILEPDALAGLDCLSASDQQVRYSAMSQAVTILKADPKLTLYIDAGNPAWQPVSTIVSRLKAANIAGADGFSLNVSNFISNSQNQAYGDQISKLVGNKHYVIDTSRNGNGPLSPAVACNSTSSALGSTPTVNTGDPLNDALLWVKIPWESDGSCGGAPAAGMVDWDLAVKLAQNAGW